MQYMQLSNEEYRRDYDPKQFCHRKILTVKITMRRKEWMWVREKESTAHQTGTSRMTTDG